MTAPDLLEELYRNQQRSMRSLAWMLLGDQESAEDAVQDCFSRLELRSLAGIDNPAAYLRTCVVNQCRSVMRTRSRFDRRADPPPALHHDPTTVEFHDALLNLTSRRRTRPPRCTRHRHGSRPGADRGHAAPRSQARRQGASWAGREDGRRGCGGPDRRG